MANLIHRQPPRADDAATTLERVMMVGHNPGISQLLYRLTGCDEDFPTAALAQIEIPVEDWGDLCETTRGELIAFWRPREL